MSEIDFIISATNVVHEYMQQEREAVEADPAYLDSRECRDAMHRILHDVVEILHRAVQPGILATDADIAEALKGGFKVEGMFVVPKED